MLEKLEKRGAVKLQCVVQNYAWGHVGKQSEVGRLYSLQSKAEIEDRPYAELWMGTHESGPSLVVLEDAENSIILLKDWLSENPEVLGDKVVKRWGTELPFLFKVLSVAKALSIQAHPDKKLAKQLHQFQPDIYKDANHKPEMALALTDFDALCGFVGPQEFKQVIETVPELHSIFEGPEVMALVNQFHSPFDKEVSKATLKAAFTAVMTAGQDVVANSIFKLVSRLKNEQKVRDLTQKEQLVLCLAKQYPDDVGVLSVFFFNYIHLAPGEALYLDANEPHAYLSGECIECMAASDNVVRAGLTPKYRDTKTLCAMLTYKQDPPEILYGVHIDPYTRRYSPPFEEFEVDCCIIPSGHSAIIPAVPGPSILLVFEGAGVMSQVYRNVKSAIGLQRGEIFFVPAGIQLDLEASMEINTTGNSLCIYRAGVSSSVL